MRQKRGKFIVLEGVDGCGKSSQALLLANFLLGMSDYNHVLLTREPYKKRKIREILRKDENPYSQAQNLAKLFVEDRREHISEIIEPSLAKGIHVVCDRYKYSTIAYQSAQGIPITELIKMHQNMLVPDATFILDVPIEIAKKRIAKGKGGIEQKFESNGEFLERVRQNYLEMSRLLPQENIIILDGTKSIGGVNQRIKKELEFLLS